MSKGTFDPSKFSTRSGAIYYDGKRVTSQYRLRQYNRFIKGNKSSRISSVSSKYSKYFGSGTKFVSEQGHLKSWAKPLSVSGGENANYNWSRVNYRDFNGKIRRIGSNQRWGTDVGGKKSGSVCILNGTRQWIRQVQISIHALHVNAENFRIIVGRRSIKVFQNSFKYQQFYSNRTKRWKPLSAYTLKKRAKRGTGSKILKEYGDLYNSIQMEENAGAITTRVYTDIVPANPSHHKKHSICYVGYHNEGGGTYGSAWNGHKPKPYIRRQFMGHSSHLNPFTDSFMRKMMKLYLFDSVFLVKKV